MMQRVGRLTLALALIAGGAAFLADNLMGTNYVSLLIRLWPALLILLGIEWIVASALSHHDGRRVSGDGGAIFLLIVVSLIGLSISGWNGWGTSGGPWWNHFNVNVSRPSAPNMPSFGPFGQVAGDAVLTEDLDLAQIQQLQVMASAASVTVQQGDIARVELHVRAYGRNREEADSLARQSALRIVRGSVTTVEQSGGAMRQDDRFVVTLPKAAAVALKVVTGSGSIAVADRTGDVNLEAMSGSVRADRIKGNAELRSTSGSISAKDIEGDVKATASSGGVLVEQVKGNLQVGSTSGSVNIADVTGKVSAQASSGSVTVRTATVGGDYELGAVSGSVHLAIPAAAGVTVNARASSGSVSGPSWLTIGEGRNSGSGAQGDGARKVSIKTSSGSIAVESR